MPHYDPSVYNPKRDPVLHPGLNTVHVVVAASSEDVASDEVECDKQNKRCAQEVRTFYLKKQLFCWEEIPENDKHNGRLIEFLAQNFGINWVKRATIKKADDSRTISVTDDYLFSWNEITRHDRPDIPRHFPIYLGKDAFKLIDFFEAKFGLEWLHPYVIIRKIGKNRTLLIKGTFVWPPFTQNYILIELDETNTKAKMTISTDNRTEELDVRIENGKLNIYTIEKNSLLLRLNDDKVNIEIDDGRTKELNAKTVNGKLNIYT